MSQSADPIRPVFVSAHQQHAMAMRVMRYQRRRVRAAIASLTLAAILLTAIIWAARML